MAETLWHYGQMGVFGGVETPSFAVQMAEGLARGGSRVSKGVILGSQGASMGCHYACMHACMHASWHPGSTTLGGPFGPLLDPFWTPK